VRVGQYADIAAQPRRVDRYSTNQISDLAEYQNAKTTIYIHVRCEGVVIATSQSPHAFDNRSPAGIKAPDYPKGRRKAPISRAEPDRPLNCEIIGITGRTYRDASNSLA
jgi:hypothetical protein